METEGIQHNPGMTQLSTSQIKALKKRVGKHKILTSDEEKIVYSYDASKRKFPPSVVALPESRDDIISIMKFAYENEIPVYPRGAGTGMSGGAIPIHGGIALVFTRMNRIIDVDEANQIATVEPGVVVSDLNKAIEQAGLFYPPGPASSDYATIGGTVAECAGGLRCVKYGVTRDYVRALEVVTMDGTVMHFGSEAVKSVSGYDIVRLLVGSEGTLAVFSAIKVRLIPAPQTSRTMAATFKNDAEALSSAVTLLQSGLIPSALEFIDGDCLEAAYSYSHNPLIQGVNGMLLIEFDGERQKVDDDISHASEMCSRTGATNVHVAEDEEAAEELWDIRRTLSPAMYEIAPTKANEDVAVPRSMLVQLFTDTKELAKKHDVTVAIFGHCGDGNVHVNFMYDETDEDERALVEKAISELFKRVVALRGTLSGEHGIGIMKMPYFSLEHGENEQRIMRGIKKLWDPKNLLNPGKIFP